MSDRRFPVSMDVAGKGKRKVDDIPTFTENDSYAIHGCVPSCALSGRYPVEPLLLSSGHTAADLGVGSSSSLGSVVNDGSPIASVVDSRSHVIYVNTSVANESEVHVPISASFPSGVHRHQPIIGSQSAGNSGASTVPRSFTTTSQSPYNRSRPRQTRRQTRLTVHVPTSDSMTVIYEILTTFG